MELRHLIIRRKGKEGTQRLPGRSVPVKCMLIMSMATGGKSKTWGINKKFLLGLGCSLVVEHLFSMGEALGSMPRTINKQTNEQMNETYYSEWLQ